MALLEIRRVSKNFSIKSGPFRRPARWVRALEDVSLDISKGETVALVGGSGCGKSTLAKLIVGLLEPDTGSILWEGQPLDPLDRLERGRKVQMVFQDPYASLNPKLSIGTQLGEVVRLAARSGPPEELLQAVGLSTDTLSHYPFQFSGGQRQRIAIARALAMSPQLIIADEPLSALDVTTQAQILELFGRLKSQYQLTFLFITHDLAVAANFADRIIVMEAGHIVEEGLPGTTLVKPQHPYTRALLEAAPHIPF